MGEEESVKVAVRVRPFTSRERQRNSTCVIEMDGNSTIISNPENADDKRTFVFDYSYWSHDGADEDENGYFSPKSDSRYIGQKEVFDDIGAGIIKNAWEGYNTSLFAYGQTGSGKSWSVVGYGANKGIVPRFCEEIFNGINIKKGEGSEKEYEVVFSMLEIYNERVHDLLDAKSAKKILKVRQHPKKGFYAQDQIIFPVKDYDDIAMRIEEGTKNRTIASTNMNATSSRAHTIVGVTFIQKGKNHAGEETTKSSVVNLVDLAGSERADSTGATGNRLKEGAAINQSLSSLGNCIAALAERSSGKKVRVPFRDSVLTKLLKNALGGNSKTIMIAALSPADINYDETLSTLRYADRAKQIKTKAHVNEDPTAKLIRELREENENLKKMLADGGSIERVRSNQDEDDSDDDNDDNAGMTEEEVKARIAEELAANMIENERMVKEMERKWEEKLAEAEKENKEKDEKERLLNAERKNTPHIYNLSPDPMLTGMIVHILKKDVTSVGKASGDNGADISLMGINILAEHCKILKSGDVFMVRPTPDAQVLINGETISGNVAIHHNDRILIGTSHLYIFSNNDELRKLKEAGYSMKPPTYEEAQEEIAEKCGLPLSKENADELKSIYDSLIKHKVSDFLPDVNEANGMSEELDRKVQFEPIVLTPDVKEITCSKDELYVKITQVATGHTWYWTKEKFMSRKFAMQEMYRNFQNNEDWEVSVEKDPFIESLEAEILVGATEVYLVCLAYMVDMTATVPLIDYRGLKAGDLEVSIIPCMENGSDINRANYFVENPDELEGKRIDFKIKIIKGSSIPKRYTDLYCKYSIFDNEDIRSDAIKECVNFSFNHCKQITIKQFTEEILDFISKKPLRIQVWGKQNSDWAKPVNNAAKWGQATREINRSLRGSQNRICSKPQVDTDAFRRIAEMILMRKRTEIMQRKLVKVRELCDEEESKGNSTVPIIQIRKILGCGTSRISVSNLHINSSSASSSSENGYEIKKNSNVEIADRSNSHWTKNKSASQNPIDVIAQNGLKLSLIDNEIIENISDDLKKTHSGEENEHMIRPTVTFSSTKVSNESDRQRSCTCVLI